MTKHTASSRRWSMVLGLLVASCVFAAPSVFAQSNGRPVAGTNVSGSTVFFSWTGVQGASAYEVCVWNDSGNWGLGSCIAGLPAAIWTGNPPPSNFSIINMPDDGEGFTWQVRTNLGGFWYGFVPFGRFVNGPSGAPFQPSLLTPPSGSTQSTTAITFTWNRAFRATRYQLQISPSPSFPNDGTLETYDTGCCYYTLATGPTTLSYTITGWENYGITYYWRVRAGNTSPGGVLQWGAYSGYFTLINGAKPDAPTLTNPTNGTGAPGTLVPFNWSSSARAVWYRLQIARDSGFTQIFFDITDDIRLTPDYLWENVQGFGDDGATYWWRVRVSNFAGETIGAARTIVNTITTCTPFVGTGTGTVAPTARGHVDTCRVTTNSLPDYYLHDVSRRIGNPAGHSHGGRMPTANFIQTRRYTSSVAHETSYDLPRGSSANNVWDEAILRSGVDAHVYSGTVYDYLNSVFNLNSFDNLGSSMVTLVDVPSGTIGSFYDDNTARTLFTVPAGAPAPLNGSLDMVGHEWGHGVTCRATTARTAAAPPWAPLSPMKCLWPAYQSGALGEAFSDWLGTATEWANGEQNWTIAEGTLALPARDMANPPSRSQPDTYLGQFYLRLDPGNCTPSTANDNCGIHTNSGVPNKMFYLLAAGGSHNSVTVQGIGIANAMAIAMRANLVYWNHDVDFHNALLGMVSAANDLHPNDPSFANQVKNAWAAVGIGTLPSITVVANPTQAGTVGGGGSYAYGASVNVTATPNSGYHFLNWTENGTEVGTTASLTFTANGDRTLTANFGVPNISVSPASFDFGHVILGSPPPTQTFTVTNLGTDTLLMASNFLSGGNYNQFATSSDTCYGASLATNATCTVNVQFAPNSTGAKFTTLYFDSNDPDTPLLAVPLTGTADPVPTFTITATADFGGNIFPAGTTTVPLHGNSPEYTIAPSLGYETDVVYLDDVPSGALTTKTFTDVTQNHTIRATFKARQFLITSSSAGGGTITPAGSSYVIYGGSKSFTISPSGGNSIRDVQDNGVSVGAGSSYTLTQIVADHTIIAYFNSPLSVGKSGAGTGTVTSSPPGIDCGADCAESYLYGTTVTLTAVPAALSLFSGWSGACSGSADCVVNMTTNTSAIATFTPQFTPVTLIMRPNSDAGPNEGNPSTPWTIGGHWEKVADDPNDGDATTLNFAGGGTKEVFTVADLLLDSDIVDSVKVRWVARKGSGAGWSGKAGVIVGAEEEHYGPTAGLTVSYVIREETFPTNPATGAAWTVQEVRAAKLVYQEVTINKQRPVASLTELVMVVTVLRP